MNLQAISETNENGQENDGIQSSEDASAPSAVSTILNNIHLVISHFGGHCFEYRIRQSFNMFPVNHHSQRVYQRCSKKCLKILKVKFYIKKNFQFFYFDFCIKKKISCTSWDVGIRISNISFKCLYNWPLSSWSTDKSFICRIWKLLEIMSMNIRNIFLFVPNAKEAWNTACLT